MLDLRAQIELERQRRDRALINLEHSFERATDGLTQKVVDGAGGVIEGAGVGMVKGVIRSSPWAACFASLGAGALASRMMFSGGSHTNSEPQRVIVEVQSNGVVAAPAAPPAPKPFNPLDFIMQGLTVYGAVQRSLQDLPPEFFGAHPQPTSADAPTPTEQPEQNTPPANNV